MEASIKISEEDLECQVVYKQVTLDRLMCEDARKKAKLQSLGTELGQEHGITAEGSCSQWGEPA
jgi:hypothetical protein